MTGQLHEGGRAYGGHIVLICGWDGSTADIRDPDEGQVNLNIVRSSPASRGRTSSL